MLWTSLGVFLSGLALVASFPPWNQGWLVWIALIPALLAAGRLPKPGCFTWRELAPGYIVGLLYFGGAFWWIGEVTVAGTVALVLYIALYPALWLALARRLWRREPPYTSAGNLLLAAELASWWIVCEWLRGWLFAGFGWNDLGVALWRSLPLAQGARLGGVLLLSWLVVFVNVVGALTLVRFYHEVGKRQKLSPHADFGVAMLAVALLFSYGARQIWPPASEAKQVKTLRFALIQPNVPQDEVHPFPPLESLERHLVLTETAAALRPQLVVWPETPVGVAALVEPVYAQTLANLGRRSDFSLLLGSLDRVDGKFFNAAFFYPPHAAAPAQRYYKHWLVPFGEYAPLADYLPVMRRLVPFDIDFSAGPGPGLFTLPDGTTAAPLICYEDTLPAYVRRVGRLGPDLLINITNDGWFRGSPGAAQHLANAVFRSIETGRPLLRAGNTGISALVEPTGRVASRLEADGREVEISGILSGEVSWTPRPAPTPYLRWGNWILALPLAFAARRVLRRR
ncbi:MAG: apolipoprotein N-acyltransferase [Verrucomicrobium sp.]|nr:apolipoprotein N-acyltransferase [Verrucomicrobium sp.]